jgi:cytochrome c peroxidase
MRNVVALLTLVGCSSDPAAVHTAPGRHVAAGEAPAFDASELTVLKTLSPTTLPPAPLDKSNAHADNPGAAALGQALFFDTGLSGRLVDAANDGGAGTLGTKGQTGRVACVSCHDPGAGFSDDRSPGKQISLGAGWGRRAAPSLLDIGQAKLLGWDGRRDTLYNMGVAALESPADMNSSRLYVAEQIYARYKVAYEAVFGPMPPLHDGTRFPQVTADQIGCHGSVAYTPSPTCTETPHGVPGDAAEFDSIRSYGDQQAVTGVVVNVGKAIGAYMRLLTSGPSRFDAWVHGQTDALNASEQRGAKIFIGPGKCIACHRGPFFSDGVAHNVGLSPAPVSPAVFLDANDEGASLGIAQAVGDPLNSAGQFSDGNDGRLPAAAPSNKGAFLTPRLRGVSRRGGFMHTGQLTSLATVVSFFNAGGSASGFAGVREIQPLGLSAQDEADVVAFLGSLTGPGPAASLSSSPKE